MANVSLFLTKFHLGPASGWDILMIIGFLVGIFLYGSFLGRNRIILLILSTYFAWIICQVLPWSKFLRWSALGLPATPSPSLKIFVFLGLILFFCLIIPRSVLSSALRIRSAADATWWQVFILSILQLGLLITLIFWFLPSEVIVNFAPLIKRIFIGPDAQFVWLTLPILGITLMRKRKVD